MIDRKSMQGMKELFDQVNIFLKGYLHEQFKDQVPNQATGYPPGCLHEQWLALGHPPPPLGWLALGHPPPLLG